MKTAKTLPSLLLLTLALAACQPGGHDTMPPAAAYDPDARAEFCGMALSEHPGPKGQALIAGRDKPVWFATARELLVFLRLPESPKDIRALYVTDMGKAPAWDRADEGGWIDARKAVYVIGADTAGAMGEAEAVPFADTAAAGIFAGRHGGTVMAFDAVPESFLFPAPKGERP